MSLTNPFLIGAHISVEGGLHKAIERALSIKCTALQIFTKSNRQWFAKPLEETEIETFKQVVKAANMQNHIVAHAAYLINLASPNAETRTKSINSLKKEIERCDALAIPYLVLHPGSHVNQTETKGLNLIVQGIDKALEGNTGTTMILLETMAGQGSSLGSTFDQLSYILKQSAHKTRLGVCLDTCHVFAAGYDFSTTANYKKMWEEFEKTIGRKNLKIIHVNDSKKECGSKVDRHEDITKGKIGTKGFELLFNDKTLDHIPKILETPKASLADDARNIKTIKNLLTPITKKRLHIA